MSAYPSFGRGILVAAGVTLIGTVAASFGASHLGIYLMALAYLCHILYHSPRTTGRVVLCAAWLVGSITLSLFDTGLLATLSFNLGSLWLARSWCHLDTILQALTDLGLWLASLLLAAVAVMHSSSYALGIWTFFLVQALWPWLARQAATWTVSETNNADLVNTASHSTNGSNQQQSAQGAFDEAKRNAESALRRLQSQSSFPA